MKADRITTLFSELTTLTLRNQELEKERDELKSNCAANSDYWNRIVGELQSQLTASQESEKRLRGVLDLLDEIELHCPCGARPESPHSHPHVAGCPVSAAQKILKAIKSVKEKGK